MPTISESRCSKSDSNALINKYIFLFRACALRFCNEANFEDFVQEGILSLLERSLFQKTDEEPFDNVVFRNCVRYQSKMYLSYYADEYDVFNDDEILKQYKLCCSLFGEEYYAVEESSDLTFEETRDIVASLIQKYEPHKRKVLENLYRLD